MKIRTSVVAVLTGATIVLAAAEPARAQATGFAVNRFDPSERGSDWFVLESLDLRGHLRPAIGIVGDGAYRPLAIYNSDGSVDTAIVNHQIFAHLGAAFTLWDRLRLGMNAPVALYQDGAGGAFRGVTYPAPDSPSFGDVRLGADVRLVGVYGDPITLAAGAQVFLPTGSRADYTGDGTGRLQPRVLAAGDIGIFAYAARLAVQYRPRDDAFGGASLGTELLFAGSAGLRLAEKKLLIGPEIFGSSGLSDPFAKLASPLEWLLGAHYRAGSFRVGAGVGTGLTRGFGTPVVRWLASVEWAPPFDEVKDRDGDGVPDDRDACPDTPGIKTDDPATNGCPAKTRPDRDGDGVFDDEDACPDTAGVRTSDPQTNGCPSDRDKDGILDSADACPDAAGPKTNDPKTTGCPDRDQDGIIDSADACPDVPGVATTDPATNGCPPDPDRDKDGIPNEQDACPDEPGKPDPDPKKNGCPKAFVSQGQIKILDQVKFKTASAEIQPGKDSEEVLQAVLKVMKDHPEITKLRVEGHTDNRGSADLNRNLSRDRAAAVVRWLVKNGTDQGRLTSQGFGPDRPIGENTSEEGRRNNRRVEFHIESAP